ncbi:IPT/TIG domain-containing protein [Actinoplanes sp. HUAS TT8]|uniref:IPT/TIG domain-containing protein n=1 Tax=Actinoplanes sp. HUAS TT8 TaxID=3447453 RepID=UPI003F51CA36
MLRRSGRAVLASAAATALVTVVLSAPAEATPPAMTLSSTTGASGGGATVTGTIPAGSGVSFPAGTTPTIQFQFTTCSASAQDVDQIAVSGTTLTAGVLTVRPSTVKRFSTTKVAFQVPNSAYPDNDGNGNPSTINPTGLVLTGAQTSARWNVCVYDTPSTVGSTLLATAAYTVAPRPTITSVVPASSPAVGGQSITVNGTGFSTSGPGVSGTIGGSALTDVTVAPNGLSFTATTGPHAAGTGLALVVTAIGGSVSSLDPDNNGNNSDAIPFGYSNGITVTPGNAVSGTSVDLDVIGAGFSALTFSAGTTPTDSDAHVFLVKDAYNAASNRGVAECVVASVVDDGELICTLDLSADQLDPTDSSVVANTPITDGAYIVTVVANGDPAAGNAAHPTIISSGATFTVAPY